MDTATRNARADRIHAIWKRRTARFKQAHYAYRLADDLSSRVGRQHPDYVQARTLATRAARVMDIISRQTMKLARLEIATIGIVMSAAALAAHAADEWTDALATLQDHAERMFKACADLRLTDAQRGRDSDVFYGRCHTLAELGLIDAQRVRQLDAEVVDLINTHYGVRHAA